MLRSVALGAALVFAAGGTVAVAADFGGAFPDPVPPAHHQAVNSWSGLYVGAHAGYGSSNWDVDLSNTVGEIIYNDPFDPPYGTLEGGSGWLGGLQAGANHQIGAAVIGIEADVSWTGIDASGTFFTSTAPGTAYAGYLYGTEWDISAKVDLFGTVRGRLGIAQGPVLLYGTAGLAWGIVSADQATTHPDPIPVGLPGAVTSGQANHIGYAVGGGLEWMVHKNWTVKAEYLFADLGKTGYVLDGTTTPTGTDPWRETFGIDLKMHAAKIGVNYLFGN